MGCINRSTIVSSINEVTIDEERRQKKKFEWCMLIIDHSRTGTTR